MAEEKLSEKKKLEQEIRDNLTILTVVQKQPYTCVVVRATLENTLGILCDYEEPGFAKVVYPDRWDERRGVRLAVDKAVSAIARRILGRKEKRYFISKSPDSYDTISV